MDVRRRIARSRASAPVRAVLPDTTFCWRPMRANRPAYAALLTDSA
jgi:hypothetical protein